MAQAGDGVVMVWGIFTWHTLHFFVSTEHHLNVSVYLSIVADYFHSVPFSNGCFQQNNVTKIKINQSSWFIEHEDEFTELKWLHESTDLNPIEYLCDVEGWKLTDVQLADLQ